MYIFAEIDKSGGTSYMYVHSQLQSKLYQILYPLRVIYMPYFLPIKGPNGSKCSALQTIKCTYGTVNTIPRKLFFFIYQTTPTGKSKQ